MQCSCAILSSVVHPALQYFSTLSHKGHDFGGGKILNVKCVLIFSKIFLKHFSFYEEFSDIIS